MWFESKFNAILCDFIPDERPQKRSWHYRAPRTTLACKVRESSRTCNTEARNWSAKGTTTAMTLRPRLLMGLGRLQKGWMRPGGGGWKLRKGPLSCKVTSSSSPLMSCPFLQSTTPICTTSPFPSLHSVDDGGCGVRAVSGVLWPCCGWGFVCG